MRTCKTATSKYVREDNSKISQFTVTVIAVARTIKFLAVLTPPSIYHGCYTWKMFWKEKFTPMKMRSCGYCNMQKHNETKSDEQYSALDIYLELGYL